MHKPSLRAPIESLKSLVLNETGSAGLGKM